MVPTFHKLYAKFVQGKFFPFKLATVLFQASKALKSHYLVRNDTLRHSMSKFCFGNDLPFSPVFKIHSQTLRYTGRPTRCKTT